MPVDYRYFFDMAGRFPDKSEYGRGFRIGDCAAGYILVLQWRSMNPGEPLLVLDDRSWPECVNSREFLADWMFADDPTTHVRTLRSGEYVDQPAETNLYSCPLWETWRNLKSIEPIEFGQMITPVTGAQARGNEFLEEQGLEDRPFIVIQPLFDAGYNTYRNRPWDYWMELAKKLTSLTPVVVAHQSDYVEMIDHTVPGLSFTSTAGLTPMETLAVISKANLMVGGETGLPLWSSILRTPTYVMLADVALGGSWYTGPISFGAPVEVQRLELEPDHHFEAITDFVRRHDLL
jgi:hypothetical protein